MSNLSVQELKKYRWRVDLFKKKIQTNDFFEIDEKTQNKVKLVNDKNILLNLEKNIDLFGGRSPKLLFETTTSKFLRLTQFKKTKEFGGGGGSGAGSEITELAECAFCIFCASLMELKKLSLDEDEIKKLRIDLGKTKISKVLDFLKNDENWYECTKKSAEKFVSNLNGKYIFHRDSVFFNSIYSAFKLLLKDRNIDKLKISNDKWNPADVWVQKIGVTLHKYNTLEEYNEFINNSLVSKALLGVSLKKTTSPTLKVVKPNNDVIKVQEIVKPIGALSSKDSYLKFKNGFTIQVRTFNANNDVQLEVKGGSSAHGKIGFGNIQHFFTIFKLGKIPNKTEINKMKNEDVLKFINSKINKFNLTATLESLLQKPELKDFKVSKYQSLFITDKLFNDEEAAAAIVKYALSQGGMKNLFEPSWHMKIS